jgi:tetratricopeptide (TPR) repeat protein
LRIILLVILPTPEISSANVAVVTNTRGRRNGDGEIIGTSGDLVGVVRMRSNARHRSKFSYQAAAGQRITGAGGSALPENIVHKIAADGLAFRPNDSYRALLKTAGADPKILTAVDSARVVVDQAPEAESGKDLLQHLATAGSMIKDKRNEEAANELTAAVTANFKNPECGFVMAQVLRLEEQWEAAAGVYDGVLRLAPDFPEVHAKLSFVLYRLNDFEKGLTEARAALKLNPENAEAHKNAGLALMSMQKFDAALAEYQEALRIKPDYEAAHVNMGILYIAKSDWDNAIASFQKAVRLNTDNLAMAHMGVGRILLAKKDYPDATRELKRAIDLMPADPRIHEFCGKALYASGKIDEAIGEFRQAATLDPKNLQMKIALAAALEKKGDWAAAIAEYRSAALADASIDLRGKTGRSDDRDPQREYADAKKRVADHEAALKAGGKASEAAALEAQIAATNAAPNLSEQLTTWGKRSRDKTWLLRGQRLSASCKWPKS